MESDKYRLEATFSSDRSSVTHTAHAHCANRPPITTVWTTKRTIGCGGNGVVDLQSEPSGLLRAVKRVHKYERGGYMKEVIALSMVSDRRDLFVEFHGWYEDQQSLYIAMEFVANGDLGVYIKAQGKSQIPEATCQAISRQLLEALQNILVVAPEPIHVKVTDFGASKYLKGTVCRTRVGTSGYMAPEIQGVWVRPQRQHPPYDTSVDLWAAGCIIHELLTLQLPFVKEWEQDLDIMITSVCSEVGSDQVLAETDMESLMRYCQGQLPLPEGALERSGVSPNAMELIRALLRADPAARVTAREALGTPWLLQPEKHSNSVIEPTALELLTSEILSLTHRKLIEVEAPPAAWADGSRGGDSPSGLEPVGVISTHCCLCQKTIRGSLKMVRRHILRVHIRSLRCGLCGVRFGLAYQLHRHQYNFCTRNPQYQLGGVPENIMILSNNLKECKNKREVDELLLRADKEYLMGVST
ncbi:kinase-like domain-containing protein [Morchella snyderi]|nr:kinase-like domain-containing protein [Morchella snyderi]